MLLAQFEQTRAGKLATPGLNRASVKQVLRNYTSLLRRTHIDRGVPA